MDEGESRDQNMAQLFPSAMARNLPTQPMVSQSTQPPPTVVVVDDDVDAVDSLSLVLEANGYCVAKAFEGRGAVSTAECLGADVVISDIEMPGMTGLEAAAQIRSLPLAKQPWMVAVTGLDQPEVRTQAIEAGFDYLLVKPVRLGEMLDLLAACCRMGYRNPVGQSR